MIDLVLSSDFQEEPNVQSFGPSYTSQMNLQGWRTTKQGYCLYQICQAVFLTHFLFIVDRIQSYSWLVRVLISLNSLHNRGRSIPSYHQNTSFMQSGECFQVEASSRSDCWIRLGSTKATPNFWIASTELSQMGGGKSYFLYLCRDVIFWH